MASQIMSNLVLTVEGIVSVEYLRDILKKPFNAYPVLNSAGNIVGMMPKSFLIVLIENHHWVETKMLSYTQRKKLIEMYSNAASVQRDKLRLSASIMATQRRFTQNKGVLRPSDWKLMNYSKEAKDYFNSSEARPSQEAAQKFATLPTEEKEETVDEHDHMLDALFRKSMLNKDPNRLSEVAEEDENEPGDAVEDNKRA